MVILNNNCNNNNNNNSNTSNSNNNTTNIINSFERNSLNTNNRSLTQSKISRTCQSQANTTKTIKSTKSNYKTPLFIEAQEAEAEAAALAATQVALFQQASSTSSTYYAPHKHITTICLGNEQPKQRDKSYLKQHQRIDLTNLFYSPPEKFNRFELKTSSPNQSSLLSSESSLNTDTTSANLKYPSLASTLTTNNRTSGSSNCNSIAKSNFSTPLDHDHSNSLTEKAIQLLSSANSLTSSTVSSSSATSLGSSGSGGVVAGVAAVATTTSGQSSSSPSSLPTSTSNSVASSVLTASSLSTTSSLTTSTSTTTTTSSSVASTTSTTASTNSSLNKNLSLINTNYLNNWDQALMMIMSNNENGNILKMVLDSNNSTNSSDDHEELLAEMELIERLPTQERLKQAKRRRALQLKKWSEYEKEINALQSSQHSNKKAKQVNFNNINHHHHNHNQHQHQTSNRSIKFQDHIVLLDAIMRKDYEEVEHLLDSGVTPNSSNEDGLTAIHQCCIDDSADLLKLLIKYGADVNVCDNDLWTPLHAAATCANLDICKILIENNADLLAVNTDGNMPYDICDDEVCLEYIESEMASRGVTQQTIDSKRSETELKMLNDLKQICLKHLSGNASYKSNPHLTSFITQLSMSPSSPLSPSSSLQFLNKMTSMTSNNFYNNFKSPVTNDGRIDLNSKDHNGATLMHIACANGYNTILEFLLNDCMEACENGAPMMQPSISIKDNDGWTPLHVATFWGHQKAIEILLENGGEINARTNNDESVLDLCDDQDVRDFIIQKSKEIEVQQKQQQAAAAAKAALQMKLKMINSNGSHVNATSANVNANGSSSQSSMKSSNVNSNNSNTNSVNANNSTRSLKRTSTGVSRSSSVRRSSFREKEKASRKLDTSFKDVLYASEQQLNSNNGENMDHALTNTGSGRKMTTIGHNEQPLIINHQKQQANNNIDDIDYYNSNAKHSAKMTTVVKVINNNMDQFNPLLSSTTIQSASNQRNLDSNNNTNQHNVNKSLTIQLQNESTSVNNDSTQMNSSHQQVARIHSNGMFNANTNQSTLSNVSMASTTSNHLPHVALNSNNSTSNNNTSSVNTSSGLHMNNNSTSNANDYVLTRNNVNAKKPPVILHQPMFTNFASNNKGGGDDDGVKYKFISNETIGAKTATFGNDFDMHTDETSSKFKTRCSKCFKCCTIS